jgi:hypothetical protein
VRRSRRIHKGIHLASGASARCAVLATLHRRLHYRSDSKNLFTAAVAGLLRKLHRLDRRDPTTFTTTKTHIQ